VAEGAADVVEQRPALVAERPTLRESLFVYRRMVGARIRADWQFRTSFFLFMLSQAAVAISDFAAIAVIFSAVDDLAGWSGPEVAFLYAISGIGFGLADVVISPVEMTSSIAVIPSGRR
jgi:ABC-2 type transport system permease protein